MEEYWNEDWELELNEDLRKRREGGKEKKKSVNVTCIISSEFSPV